jgi:mannose-1-phosphate guanylyltransferase
MKSNVPMKAVILVGGEGTRLRPLTYSTVKAMVPVLNRPFIEHMLHYLSLHNINEAVLAMGYKPDTIKSYFNKVMKPGISLSYSVEDTPLGTAGAVKHAERNMNSKEPFFVLNGDVFTDIDLTGMLNFHREKKASVTIALTPVDDPTQFGVVETDGQQRVKRFVEKPKREDVFSNLINAGIYIMEPELLGRIPRGQKCMFEHDIFPGLLADGAPVYGYPTDTYWMDTGTPGKYLTLNRDLVKGKYTKPLVKLPADGVMMDATSFVHEQAVISGPAVIGSGCVVGKGARLIGPVVFGAGCRIGDNTIIESSVLWQDVSVGSGALVRNSIIASDNHIEDQARIDSAVIGANTIAGKVQPVS